MCVLMYVLHVNKPWVHIQIKYSTDFLISVNLSENNMEKFLPVNR